MHPDNEPGGGSQDMGVAFRESEAARSSGRSEQRETLISRARGASEVERGSRGLKERRLGLTSCRIILPTSSW